MNDWIVIVEDVYRGLPMDKQTRVVKLIYSPSLDEYRVIELPTGNWIPK